MVYEWMAKWIDVKADKDADQLLQVMVRNSFLIEKGNRKNLRGFKLDNERIDEMSKTIVVYYAPFVLGVRFNAFAHSSSAEFERAQMRARVYVAACRVERCVKKLAFAVRVRVGLRRTPDAVWLAYACS